MNITGEISGSTAASAILASTCSSESSPLDDPDDPDVNVRVWGTFVPIRVPSRAPPRRLQRPDKFGQEQARPAQSGASAAQTASRVGCATCTPPSRRLRLLKRRWSASGRAAQEQTADAHSRTCLVELVSGVANRRCRRASQHARLTGVRKLEIRQSDLISWDQLAVFP